MLNTKYYNDSNVTPETEATGTDEGASNTNRRTDDTPTDRGNTMLLPYIIAYISSLVSCYGVLYDV